MEKKRVVKMKKNIKILLFCSTVIGGSTVLQSSEQEIKAINILRENAKIIFNETSPVNDYPTNISCEMRRYVERVAPIAHDCDILIDGLRNYRNILYSRPLINTRDSSTTQIPHQKHLSINMAFFRDSSGDMTTTNPLLVQKGEMDLMTTPLHYAFDCYKKAKTKEQQLSADANIRLLIEHGANVNARDYKQQTPLHKAHKHSHIALLIQHRAFRDAQDSKGRTPLLKQLKKERLFLAQNLLIMKATIHIPDELGNTAFHFAAKQNNIGIIHYLAYYMLKGNNWIISQPNNNNERPLDIANRKGNHKIASLIENIIMNLFSEAILQQQLKRVKKLWRENSDWLSISIPSPLGNSSKNKCVNYLERVCKEEE